MAQGNPDLLKALAEIDPRQPYGTELFDALARITVSVAIEAVCLRFGLSSGIEVYLTQRSPNDTAYPGLWHCPGSVMRPGESLEDVFNRLNRKKFGTGLSSKRFVENFNHPTETRGHFFSVIYLCVLEGTGLQGRWFSVNRLPEETVEQHRKEIIPRAVKMFIRYAYL